MKCRYNSLKSNSKSICNFLKKIKARQNKAPLKITKKYKASKIKSMSLIIRYKNK